MKIFIQVIDTRTGIYQTGMIDEAALPGQEIGNALMHFGVSYGTVIWDVKHDIDFLDDVKPYKTWTGHIDGTTKIVSLICY